MSRTTICSSLSLSYPFPLYLPILLLSVLVSSDYQSYNFYPPSFDDLFDQLVIISTKSTSRLPIVDEIIKTLDTSRVTIVGVNGTDLVNNRSHHLWQVVTPNFLDTFTPGELGCALSHRTAYELILRNNYSNALIVEDDVQFHKVHCVYIKILFSVALNHSP